MYTIKSNVCFTSDLEMNSGTGMVQDPIGKRHVTSMQQWRRIHSSSHIARSHRLIVVLQLLLSMSNGAFGHNRREFVPTQSCSWKGVVVVSGCEWPQPSTTALF
jgi:hypothetical protein